MDQKTKTLYNTEIIGSYKKLEDKGYIYTGKLKLSRTGRKNMIEEARKKNNNLALQNSLPIKVFVKKDFYWAYAKYNAEKPALLEIKIKSEDSTFIDKLQALLARSEKTEFTIISSVNAGNISAEDKILFLSSDLISTDFDVRILNCLMSRGIGYVFEIFEIIEHKDDLLKIQNFGKKSLKNLKEEFKKKGLNFNNVPKKLLESAKLYRQSLE